MEPERGPQGISLRATYDSSEKGILTPEGSCMIAYGLGACLRSWGHGFDSQYHKKISASVMEQDSKIKKKYGTKIQSVKE